MRTRARFAPTLAISATLFVAACGSEPEPAPSTPPAAPAAEATTAAAAAPTPAATAPTIPGTSIPNVGTLRADAPAYFPTRETAERLGAGTLGEAGSSYFRGTVVSVDDASATATVRDLQSHEYAVPLAYVIQASAPVTSVQAGEIFLGERFNRGELVMVLDATPDERGEIATAALTPFMPDTVRTGRDALADLVPVTDGGPGTNAVCRGPNGVRGYQVIRHAAGFVLGFDGSFIRALPEGSCRFAPLRPELTAGQTIAYTHATSHRAGATVQSIDASTGAVNVTYPWGAEQREDVARFGSIVTELPPER